MLKITSRYHPPKAFAMVVYNGVTETFVVELNITTPRKHLKQDLYHLGR